MTEFRPHADFPSDETLAAFIDRRLDEAMRRRVVEHMATCPQCYDVVLGANAMRVEAGVAPNVVPFPRRRVGLIALTAAAAAVVAALFVGPIRERVFPSQKSGMAALIAAVPQQRNVEGRISGFPYQPRKPILRGPGDDTSSAEDLKLRSVALALEADAKANPTPDKLHTYAIAKLVLGDDQEAVKALEELLHRTTGEPDRIAAIRKSTDASLLSDLAVAYISRGERRANAEDFLIATEAADRAWKLAPTAEHAWNRAVAIEHDGGGGQAIQAWSDYLKLDADSQWAAEARKHLKPPSPTSLQLWPAKKEVLHAAALRGDAATVRAVVAAFPQTSRSHAEDELLPSWAAARLKHDVAESAASLVMARAIGDALAGVNGEHFIEDVTQCIARSPAPDALAAAIADYDDWRKKVVSQHVVGVVEGMSAAAQRLRKLQCPLWIRAATYTATASFYDGRFEQSIAETVLAGRAIPNDEGRPRYPSVLFYAYWARGLSQLSLGRQYESLDSYQTAAKLAERLGESESSGFLDILAAEALQHLGRSADAWNAVFEATRTLRSGGSSRRLPIVYSVAARYALDANYAASASVFNELAFRVPTQEPTFRLMAYLVRASAAAAEERAADAAAAVASAEKICDSIADAEVRRRAWADIQIVKIGCALDLDRSKGSADDLDAVIQFFEERRDAYRLPLLLLWRAENRARSGNVAGALADHVRAFELLRPFEADLKTTANRRSWESATRKLVDDAIRLAILQGRSDLAFQWTERVRQLHFAVTAAPPSIENVRQSLGDDEVLASFWSESDVMYVWAVRKQTFDLFTLREPRTELAAAVSAFRAAAMNGSSRSQAADLYRRLFAPIESKLDGVQRIIVVPDSTLTMVPFAALYDSARQQYLCQRAAIAVAPSVSQRTPRSFAANGPQSALVIADPAFDTTMFARFSRLAGARAEASIVSDAFARTTRLTGGDATPANVKRHLAGCSTVHYAGHAISNDEHPDLSALLLARDRVTGEQLLYASEIRPMNLHHIALVVLDGCETATGARDGGDFSPLATAFLQAGVPTVVGTLWPIPDNDSAAFLAAFYRELRRGNDPIVALQKVQAEAAARGSRSWQAYEIITA